MECRNSGTPQMPTQFHNFQFPTLAQAVAPYTARTAFVSYNLWMPSDAAGDFSKAYGVQLGYLSEIWRDNRRSADLVDVGHAEVQGGTDFYLDAFVTLGGRQIRYAEVQVELLAKDSDMGFGTNPTIHAGWVAFGRTQPETIVQTQNGFEIVANEETPALGPLRYINHMRSIFPCDSPEYSGVWVKVKPHNRVKVTLWAKPFPSAIAVDCSKGAPTREPICDAEPDNWTDQFSLPFITQWGIDTEGGDLMPRNVRVSTSSIPAFTLDVSWGMFDSPKTDVFGRPLRLSIADQNGVFFNGPPPGGPAGYLPESYIPA